MASALKKLMTLRPLTANQQWMIVTAVLNRDIDITEANPLYGYLLPFGCFATQEEAEAEVRRLIQISGYRELFIVPYGTLLPLREHEVQATPVLLDHQGQLLQWEREQSKRDAREYERASEIRKSVILEAEQETDPTTLEYFKRQCYLALQHHANYREHLSSAEEERKKYEEYRTRVREHIQAYPQHESMWLPHLKQTLLARGEESLYLNVEQAYQCLRSDLLGLSSIENGLSAEKKASGGTNKESSESEEESVFKYY